MVDDSVVTLLVDQFEQLGIEIHGWPDEDLREPLRTWPVDLVRRDSFRSYLLVYRPKMHFSDVIAIPDLGLPLLVVGDRVSERSATSFREAGIQYLDAVGNAYLEFGQVLIDIRGRRPLPDVRSVTTGVGKSSNLFSSRRARVVCALLAWPELEQASVREIASTAGVSTGLVHDSLELLVRGKYLDDDHPRRLRRQAALLDYWTAAYPSALGPSLALAQFAGDIEQPLPAGPNPFYLSGESAVTELLRPASLTIYTEKLDPRLPVVNRWRTDGRPNIFVRKKFWAPPFGLDDWAPGPQQAPWPLVYADLMAAGEPRQAEAARDFRSTIAPDY